MAPPSLRVAASGDDGVVGIPALVVNGPVSLPPSNGNGNGNGLHSADPQHKKGNGAVSAERNGAVSASAESGNGPPAANGSKREETAEKAEKKPNTTTTTTTTTTAAAAATSTTAARDNAGRHAGLGHKSILQSDALYQYMLNTSVYPREHSSQSELREITAKHPWNLMTTPPDEGQFLMLLMKLINAKNTMELGVYTGYSLLSTALALPEDGKIIAIDMNRENYQLGAPVIEKAGLSHKIDFREGLILPQLDEMLQEDKNHGFFDFIFVDADKDNYIKYHERLIKLVKVGGVIGYDNTLWNGSLVAPDDAPYPKYIRHYRPFILELNTFLAADQRIDISQVPIGDGITLCRRLI